MDHGELRLSIFIHQLRGAFWAYCPEFELSASGSSAEEAREAVLELVDDFIGDLHQQHGDRDPLASPDTDWDAALIAGGLEADRSLN